MLSVRNVTGSIPKELTIPKINVELKPLLISPPKAIRINQTSNVVNDC